MIFWSGPPQTPPLETHFFLRFCGRGGGGGGVGVGGGVKNVEKMTPPFFWVENHESFGFFRF